MFSNEAKTLVVVAIKGTSAAFLHVGGPTHDKDKYNVRISILHISDERQTNYSMIQRIIPCSAVVVQRSDFRGVIQHVIVTM